MRSVPRQSIRLSPQSGVMLPYPHGSQSTGVCMKRLLAIAALGTALAACATTPGASTPAPAATPSPSSTASAAETEAILGVVDRFLLAIGNHDDAALEELIIEEGISYFQERTPTEDSDVSPYPNASMLEPDPDADPFIERYWSPAVQVRGGLAQVWAPYELRDNGKQVHCGIDAFDLVLLDGAWRIATVLSTMEPKACDSMMPASPSAMRPRDGWKETRNE